MKYLGTKLGLVLNWSQNPMYRGFLETVPHFRAKEMGKLVEGALGEYAEGSVGIRNCLQQLDGVSCVGFKAIHEELSGKRGGSEGLA